MEWKLIIESAFSVLNALGPVIIEALRGGRSPEEIEAAARAAVLEITPHPIDVALSNVMAEYDRNHPAPAPLPQLTPENAGVVIPKATIRAALARPEVIAELRLAGWKR